MVESEKKDNHGSILCINSSGWWWYNIVENIILSHFRALGIPTVHHLNATRYRNIIVVDCVHPFTTTGLLIAASSMRTNNVTKFK